MNNMRILTFVAVAGAAAAGEGIQLGGPMAARDTCPELPSLCTGPVMVHGTGTTLTYLCPKTTDASATTVHHTVTVTTTVAPGETSVIPPKDTPHGSGLTEVTEPTTTTTVHSTATQFKTFTVTRKPGSPSAPLTLTPILEPSKSADVPPSSWSSVNATSVSSKASVPINLPPTPWPNVNTTIAAPKPSVPANLPPMPFPIVNTTSVWTSLPTVRQSWTLVMPNGTNTPTDMPTPAGPIGTNITMPTHKPTHSEPLLSLLPSESDVPVSDVPVTPSSTLLPEKSDSTTTTINDPSPTSSGTDEVSVVPVSVNATSTRGYSFPTVHQIRDVLNATTPAKPTKTGSAGQKSVSVAVLFCGLAVVAYFV